jgi:hypothetical protein
LEKKQWDKSQSRKDHLHSKNSVDGVKAIDHDKFTHIPGGKGEDEACKDSVGYVFRVA